MISSEAFLDLLTQRKAFSILPCHRIISVPPGSVHFPFLAVKKAHSEWLQRLRARGTILQTLVVQGDALALGFWLLSLSLMGPYEREVPSHLAPQIGFPDGLTRAAKPRAHSEFTQRSSRKQGLVQDLNQQALRHLLAQEPWVSPKSVLTKARGGWCPQTGSQGLG